MAVGTPPPYRPIPQQLMRKWFSLLISKMTKCLGFRFISPYLNQFAFVVAFGIDWENRTTYSSDPRINGHHGASFHTSQPASVSFPRSSPSRTQATAGELDNLSQPTGEGRGLKITPTSRVVKTQPRQTKGQFLKSVRLHPKGTIHYTGVPSSELNFCPSRYTVVRPSTDEMGAVTLQSAPGNPTLQMQHSALWQRSKNHRFICVFTDQTSAVNVADIRKRISFRMCKDIFIVSAITLCFYFLKTFFNYIRYAIC